MSKNFLNVFREAVINLSNYCISRFRKFSAHLIYRRYSVDQLYDVVANVDDYKYFVPWCVASKTFEQSETHARADLEVGFPPISEKYTSVLTLARPNLVRVRVLTKALCSYRFFAKYLW